METLLNKVNVGTLDKLHNALCETISIMNECQHSVKARYDDEDYVKCMNLESKVLKVIADKSK